MCNYKKESPQPKTIPYPRATFVAECGFYLMLKEGYSLDWRNNKTYKKPLYPKGKCMKCNQVIEIIGV